MVVGEGEAPGERHAGRFEAGEKTARIGDAAECDGAPWRRRIDNLCCRTKNRLAGAADFAGAGYNLNARENDCICARNCGVEGFSQRAGGKYARSFVYVAGAEKQSS